MLTDKKDLLGGKLLWPALGGSHVVTSTKLGDETCEVAIVGGGVTGALIALTLAKAGLDVIVVDRRKPGSGSTSASTAMIQFELDTPLRELAERMGTRRAYRAYRRSLKAVQDLKRLIATERIDCDWQDRDTLYLAGDVLGSRGLKQESRTRQRAGLPCTFLRTEEVAGRFGLDRTGAIHSSGAAELNPARLTAGALNAARSRGARLYSEHEIVRVTSEANQTVLTSTTGDQIICVKAVFATGYETVKSLPKARFDLTSSWAIATAQVDPASLWPSRCLIWEASEPYLYIRTTTDNRVIVGGEDSDLRSAIRREKAVPAKSIKLLNALNNLLPGRSFEIEYAWAGAFAVSPTGLPILQPLDGHPNCFAVLGCGGNGITFSMVAAQVVEAWVAGKRDPDAALFEEAGKVPS